MEDVCVVCFALLVIVLISRFSFEKRIEEGLIMDELQRDSRGPVGFKNYFGGEDTATPATPDTPNSGGGDTVEGMIMDELQRDSRGPIGLENGMEKVNGNGMKKVNGNGMKKVNGDGNNITGYDDSLVHFSIESSFGSAVAESVLPSLSILSDPTVIKPNLNTNIEVPRGAAAPSDSQMPAFDKTAKGGLLDVPEQGQMGAQGNDQPKKEKGGNKSVEVHMVYAGWCGHSKNALPAFESLEGESGMTTKSGKPITFVLTEEASDEFKMFKGAVRGFPTYMVVEKENGEVVSKKELPLASRKKEDIVKSVQKLP